MARESYTAADAARALGISLDTLRRWDRDGRIRTERERLMFVRGMGDRTAQLLEEAGYKTVEDVNREDEDKLAIKTGLGIKKARAIKQGAEHFLSHEAKVIDTARRAAKERSTAQA